MLYFFDDEHIAMMEGLVRTPGIVEKLGSVLVPDRPSDGSKVMTFASSLIKLDDGRWRLYYSTPKRREMSSSGIAIAHSSDGLHWDKPLLGQRSYEGKDTNQLFIMGIPDDAQSYYHPQVFQLTDDRWRMYFWINKSPYLRYVLAESNDGLHWRVLNFDQPILYHPLELGPWVWMPGTQGLMAQQTCDTTEPSAELIENFGQKQTDKEEWGHLAKKLSTDELIKLKASSPNDVVYIYQNPKDQTYEMYATWPVPNPENGPRRTEVDNAPFMLRAICRKTSEDGITWSDPKLIIMPDEQDDLYQQFYFLSVHRQDGWRIGMLGSYPVDKQTMDIELCFSRDGRRWDRPLRSPWIPHGPSGSDDAGMIHAPNCLLDIENDWLLLYTASPYKHGHGLQHPKTDRLSEICAARFPKRRFVALTAKGQRPGKLWTRPFILNGTNIYLDAKIEGQVVAELCDPFGKPFAGFEKACSQQLSGDSTGHVLRWKSDSSTAMYQYGTVSLRIELKKGSIYNISWN